MWEDETISNEDKEVCEACNGTGKVTECLDDSDEDKMDGVCSVVECSVCNGTGYIN